MPFADLKRARIHYHLTASSELPVLVFCNSLGTDFTMWDAQFAAFSSTFRILRYDARGQGQSSCPPGSYTIEQLAKDLLGLLEHLKLPRAFFCGLSMGGLTGMWLGMHAPEHFHKIVLANAALRIGTVEGWNTRIETVAQNGVQSIASSAVERWFSASFRNRFPQVTEGAREMLLSTSANGYMACCAAIRDADFSVEDQVNSISSIRLPTMVIAGAHDPVTTPADARAIVGRISGSHYAELQAAHLSNIEAAPEFTMEVGRFLGA
jgi:3-oxoadipate enol-lactonase